MSISSTINRLAEKFLYLWVRSNVVPSDIGQLGIDNDKPVVYVLYQRSWSNLLVLSHETSRLSLHSPLARISSKSLHRLHSVYTIAPKLPFKAWLLNQPKRSKMLEQLLDYIESSPANDVQLVPVTFYWGRPVAKQKHWLTLLFSDSWNLAGHTRKFFTILFHGKNTLVTFSAPISLRSLVDAENSHDTKLDHIQQTLVTRLVDMKTATLGPDISHRNILIRQLLRQKDVQQAIINRSQYDKISEYKASLQARRYLREIVADCTNITIQVMQRLLTTFWNRFYSGTQVNHKTELQQLALSHSLVYVPCHRSHVDYLLLSYLIHAEGLALPYIAAGKNLNMPIIGTIFRGGGAFFIRRTFKDNELYSTLMFEYIAALVAKGTPLEYFIEGGRSRTGRLLRPKPGMLSMTIRGFLKYKVKPVAFIPVYIGYEKMIESKSYLAELSGEDKKTETFFGSILSVLKLHGQYGKVTTNFGKAILLDEVLDNNKPDWRTADYHGNTKPGWLIDTVNEVATGIMQNINQCADLNATNLVSCILLSTPKLTMDEKELSQLIVLYTQLIRSISYSDRITHTELDPAHQIKHLESLKLIKRRTHELGDIIYLDSKQSVALTYYRNNALHLFALPSIIACCFLNMRSQTSEQITDLIKLVYPFIQSELFLKWQADEIDTVICKTLDDMSALGLLVKNEQLDIYSRPGSGAAAYTHLNLLSHIISPVLEVYYMTLALLSVHADKPLSRSDLEAKSVLMAQRISMMNESNAPDYFDRKLISNFVDNLIATEFLHDASSGELRFGDAFNTADKHARLLLSRSTRTNILQILKLNI